MPESGYAVVIGGQKRFESYEPNAERLCLDWLQRQYIRSGFRLEFVERPTEAELLHAQRESDRRREGRQGYMAGQYGYVDDGEGPRDKGQQLGKYLATLIGIGANPDQEALTFIGMWLAEKEGFSSLKAGNMFVMGFIKGFTSVSQPIAPKRLGNGDPSSETGD